MNFKIPITIGLNNFLTKISDNYDISLEDLQDKYLVNNKNEKNTSNYMLFIKQMHENHDDDYLNKTTFINKSKIIGNKWKKLTDDEKLEYKTIANNSTLFKICSNIKNNISCPKFVYNDTSFCKKHYKENSKKLLSFNKSYKNPNHIFSVDIIIIDNQHFYKDQYGYLYKMLEDGSGEIVDS